MEILKLIRWSNLIIVVLTQYLLYHFVLVLPLGEIGFRISLDWIGFTLMTVMTSIVAAAGYVINDIYDQVIDNLNKPNKVIVGTTISEKKAWNIYYFLIGGGFIIATLLTWQTQFIFWLGLYVFATAMMFLYSKIWKRQPFIGNFIVAFFCGLTAFIVAANDLPILTIAYKVHPIETQNIIYTLFGYDSFAFLTTLYREIIKDMEDAKGDAFQNCKTLPIVLGLNGTKVIAGSIAIIMFLMTAYWAAQLWKSNSFWEFAYLVLSISIPINMSILLLIVSKDTSAFHRLSQFIKLIMLGGLLYLIVQYLL